MRQRSRAGPKLLDQLQRHGQTNRTVLMGHNETTTMHDYYNTLPGSLSCSGLCPDDNALCLCPQEALLGQPTGLQIWSGALDTDQLIGAEGQPRNHLAFPIVGIATDVNSTRYALTATPDYRELAISHLLYRFTLVDIKCQHIPLCFHKILMQLYKYSTHYLSTVMQLTRKGGISQ